jgi:hypothetical protein
MTDAKHKSIIEFSKIKLPLISFIDYIDNHLHPFILECNRYILITQGSAEKVFFEFGCVESVGRGGGGDGEKMGKGLLRKCVCV